MNVLVAGGAGYIGSHTVRELISAGHKVVVYDNLCKGHKAAVDKKAIFIKGELEDFDSISKALSSNRIDSVMHFSSFIEVGESVIDPYKYYKNNIVNTLTLLEAMRKNNVNRIIFSSSAAVYGTPKTVPINEDSEINPINPYGETKMFIERMLRAYEVYGLRSVCLRYFNAAGAHPSAEIGEDHDPESHLIPIVLQVALGKRKEIKIFGDDYPTKDGTCVRDYIHVVDLANAHILALEHLKKTGVSDYFNLGNGKGFSVKELIEIAKEVTGKDIRSTMDKRREGDPPSLVASSDKIKKVLGWKPKYNNLKKILETAWNWHIKHPEGYKNL